MSTPPTSSGHPWPGVPTSIKRQKLPFLSTSNRRGRKKEEEGKWLEIDRRKGKEGKKKEGRKVETRLIEPQLSLAVVGIYPYSYSRTDGMVFAGLLACLHGARTRDKGGRAHKGKVRLANK
jgi:hypothetical protein